ncbi:hypothetical protein JTE90_000278 [Oedothorax gibbosus]|uniref:Uncharacterized protein n=1 Tax=Oedothorax gibbosus TaxID=931172 RepID=A0AAV6VRZ2_9ARAC|nr:hypothetical protein JTE90_000278 [Oedothorax gibbosus]
MLSRRQSTTQQITVTPPSHDHHRIRKKCLAGLPAKRGKPGTSGATSECEQPTGLHGYSACALFGYSFKTTARHFGL